MLYSEWHVSNDTQSQMRDEQCGMLFTIIPERMVNPPQNCGSFNAHAYYIFFFPLFCIVETRREYFDLNVAIHACHLLQGMTHTS